MTSSSRKEVVEITYRSPGATPPIFVAGAFTHPEWQPHELEYRIVKQTPDCQLPEYDFFKLFDISPGSWQYKFRLGRTGDWWVCDEKKDTVMDAMGNWNNLLIIESCTGKNVTNTHSGSYNDSSMRCALPGMGMGDLGPTPEEPLGQEQSVANDGLYRKANESTLGNNVLLSTSEDDSQPLLGKDVASKAVPQKSTESRSPSADSSSRPQRSDSVWISIWQGLRHWVKSLLGRLFGLHVA